VDLIRLEHQAFLAEYVAARLQHVASDAVVREERRDDEYRVEILTIEQLVIVAVSGRIVADGLYAMGERGGPNIAKRDAVTGIDIFEVLEQITTAATRANDAILHLIVGGFNFLDKRSGGNGGDGSSGLDQVAAGQIVILGHRETPMAIVADRRKGGGSADGRIKDMALAIHPIAATERARRARVYEEALASVRLEGFDLDNKVKALYRRYMDGELTLAEVGREIDELDDREFGPVSPSRHKGT
jgi:hypothetical protein